MSAPDWVFVVAAAAWGLNALLACFAPPPRWLSICAFVVVALHYAQRIGS